MTIQQPLIGISGRKRAGKDTLAAFLVQDHDYTRLAFADPLKAVAAEFDPIVEAYTMSNYGNVHEWRLQQELTENTSDTDPTGWEHAKAMPEVRRILQVLGSSIRTHLGAHVWVDAAMSKAAYLLAEGRPVVIPDVRFPNEADAIRDRGGLVVRVNRPGTADGTAPTDLHISETAMDGYDFDATITNDGDKVLLQRNATVIALAAYGKRY